jgi:hypothetical protein
MPGQGPGGGRRRGHPSGGPGLSQLARSGITPGPQPGHSHDTPRTGGHRTSLAGIGPAGKIQLDRRKRDQFQSTSQPDPTDRCGARSRRSSTARPVYHSICSHSQPRQASDLALVQRVACRVDEGRAADACSRRGSHRRPFPSCDSPDQVTVRPPRRPQPPRATALAARLKTRPASACRSEGAAGAPRAAATSDPPVPGHAFRDPYCHRANTHSRALCAATVGAHDGVGVRLEGDGQRT